MLTLAVRCAQSGMHPVRAVAYKRVIILFMCFLF